MLSLPPVSAVVSIVIGKGSLTPNNKISNYSWFGICGVDLVMIDIYEPG